MSVRTKEESRRRRHRRVRKKITGTADCPRLCVFRSIRYIYAQLIDDDQGKTLVVASNNEPELKGKSFASKTEAAGEVGALLAKRAKEAGLTRVVFDRAGYLYHGRVKALADGARKEGLQL